MSLQFLQERTRAKTDRRARVTVPHSFSYSVHSVRARDRKVVTQISDVMIPGVEPVPDYVFSHFLK